MNFEEQFPSLKNSIIIYDEENPYRDYREPYPRAVDIKHIKDCCLDKQKAKKIINKYLKGTCEEAIIAQDLIRELDLK